MMQMDMRTKLYHSTGFAAIASIINRGVQLVGSDWGGGELGPGFYTATTVQGAASYLRGSGGVLEVVTIRKLKGHGVTPPPKWEYKTVDIAKLCLTHDYLFKSNTTPILEYKFNQRSMRSLSVTNVYLMGEEGWEPMTPKAYLDVVEG